MSAKEITVQTPAGEVIKLDPLARLKECEERLEQALKDVAHYQTVTKLLSEKLA